MANNNDKFIIEHEPNENFETWTRKEIEFIRNHLAPLYQSARKAERKAERNSLLIVLLLVVELLLQASPKFVDLIPLAKLILGLP